MVVEILIDEVGNGFGGEWLVVWGGSLSGGLFYGTVTSALAIEASLCGDSGTTLRASRRQGGADGASWPAGNLVWIDMSVWRCDLAHVASSTPQQARNERGTLIVTAGVHPSMQVLQMRP
jgi:hypothetical protein